MTKEQCMEKVGKIAPPPECEGLTPEQCGEKMGRRAPPPECIGLTPEQCAEKLGHKDALKGKLPPECQGLTKEACLQKMKELGPEGPGGQKGPPPGVEVLCQEYGSLDECASAIEAKLASSGHSLEALKGSCEWSEIVNCVKAAIAQKGAQRLQLRFGSAEVSADGISLPTDAAPVVIENRTFVPVRAVSEMIGATVGWDAQTRTVTIEADGKRLSIPVDSNTATLDGKEVPMDASAQIVDGRTVLPLRFVSESLGLKVEWDAKTQTITIER